MIDDVGVLLGFALTLLEKFSELLEILGVILEVVFGELKLRVVFKSTDEFQLTGHLLDVFKRDDCREKLFFLLQLRVLGVLVGVHSEDLADLLPGVESAMHILEGDGEVLLSLLVRPRDDGLPLPMELDVGQNDLIFQQILRVVMLLHERHFVVAVLSMLNTKIASTAVVPGTLYVEFVQLGPKLLFLGLIEFYDGDFVANNIVEHFPIFFIRARYINLFIQNEVAICVMKWIIRRMLVT